MISGAAKVAGVMGWPVAHSLSPRLHGYWLDVLGLDGAYVPFAVRPEDLGLALKALPRLGVVGINLTVPHKERALPLMARLDKAARTIGAVNTVTAAPDGLLTGRNTDAYGFLRHLEESAPSWRPGSGAAVVLGAGGAARAAIHALQEAGVADIRMVNRTPERAQKLLREFGLGYGVFSLEEVDRAFPEAALLVNATSLGMTGAPPLELSLDGLPEGCIVYDLVYAPLETPLLAAARARGHKCVDGLGMLIHQAVPAFEAFFGVRPEVTAEVRRYLLERL
ncbi:MAG: shikimate dehydrogenase [bacterium]